MKTGWHIGIIILGVLMIVSNLLGLGLGIMLFCPTAEEHQLFEFNIVSFSALFQLVVLPICFLISGIGLLLLKKWGRILALLFSVPAFLFVFATLSYPSFDITSARYIKTNWILFYLGFTFVYLCLPQVKKLFGREKAQSK